MKENQKHLKAKKMSESGKPLQGGGHALGAGENSKSAATPEEVRRRRLAALDRLSNDASQNANNTKSSTRDNVYQQQEHKNENVSSTVERSEQEMAGSDSQMSDDYNEDAALQAALALSLKETTSTAIATTEINEIDAMDEEDQLEAALHLSLQEDTNTSKTVNSKQLSAAFQKHLQNAEPTNILSFHSLMWDPSIVTKSDQCRWLLQPIQFKTENTLAASIQQEDSVLASMVADHSWGLTQQHGGPCGVLASIQAELLKLLLFGPRNSSGLPTFPDELSNNFVLSTNDLSQNLLRHGLASAMGMILARASLQASATLYDDATDDLKTESKSKQQQHDVADVDEMPTVYIVTPRSSRSTDGLEWHHFEPWTLETAGGKLSEHLITYSVTIPTPSKRPRLATSGNVFNNEAVMKELAQEVAQFLLQTNLLECFHRPGGVLLFVTSLALSRGLQNIQSEMDDSQARLTSNFGHCSQELINLLLTGQAVSNVFDNTLRPSGELICRGIQQRPDIGYLSQLEALRYLEVGGFYKTPKFPIWVVASSSHFTTMFGDAACLKESVSDVLLEKVRRAFKRMEGGAEENGFIQAHQLSTFLKAIDLSLPESSIQALSAAMEVHGTGIILWEDLWKKTSRLLTGASVEAVLSSDDHLPSQSTSQPEVLSDEELARRLQAEWNGEEVVAPEPTPLATPMPVQSKETYGDEFQLYHYNGLRGGTMRPFRVTRLSADEAIGASVALGSTQHSSVRYGGDLEDVLRCKWPSCKINWLGERSPPSID